MSEYINNVTQRKQILKNVLRQLHEGKSVEEVKSEFGALARQASSSEIASIEQMLIDEGLPPEAIQSLCDVHVAVFKEGLDEQKTPDMLPGHPIYTLREENQVTERFLGAMDQSVRTYIQNPDPARLKTLRFQAEQLRQLDRHYLRQEQLIFPYLEQRGYQGPSKVLWGVHDEIREGLGRLLDVLGADNPAVERIGPAYRSVSEMIRGMIYKEERIVFQAALDSVTEAEWGIIRAHEAEIGYFLVAPGNAWKPKTAPDAVEPPAQGEPVEAVNPAELSLETGRLSLEQINLMLTHLPVDITFVDQDDIVRYYSQTPARIFQRSPAIIGRKVQNCHPPQSVAKVQRILEDFRQGKRDTAEFWIHMGGKMIYIRYFAVRDPGGQYRGTLEVTEEIGPIQALQGERRLLDENG